MNDLQSCCENFIPLLLADDTKLLRIGLNADVYQSELDEVFTWTQDNKLPLILDKCSHSTFKGDFETLYLENDAVENKCWEKDLGLIVQNDLEWSRHIDNNCSKGFKIFYMIERNVSNLPNQSKLHLHKSMTVPRVLYASCCFELSMYVSRQLGTTAKLTKKSFNGLWGKVSLTRKPRTNSNVYRCRDIDNWTTSSFLWNWYKVTTTLMIWNYREWVSLSAESWSSIRKDTANPNYSRLSSIEPREKWTPWSWTSWIATRKIWNTSYSSYFGRSLQTSMKILCSWRIGSDGTRNNCRDRWN